MGTGEESDGNFNERLRREVHKEVVTDATPSEVEGTTVAEESRRQRREAETTAKGTPPAEETTDKGASSPAEETTAKGAETPAKGAESKAKGADKTTSMATPTPEPKEARKMMMKKMMKKKQ